MKHVILRGEDFESVVKDWADKFQIDYDEKIKEMNSHVANAMRYAIHSGKAEYTIKALERDHNNRKYGRIN